MTTPTRWRIVPAEPTREVLTALRSSTGLSLTPAAKAYAAMLAAAPAPKADVLEWACSLATPDLWDDFALRDERFEPTRDGVREMLRPVIAALAGEGET